MSNGQLNNDLILFGDIDPDVVRLSHIYDPDKDYVLTSDATFQSGVEYYTKEGSGTLVNYVLAEVVVGTSVPEDTYYVAGTGPDQSGLLVPSVNSLVVDDTIGGGVYVLYVVHSVNETTLKTTLRPINLVESDDDAPNRIVGYGNDVYSCFYDIRTSATYLRLDRKLVFYGKRASYYQLSKLDADGNKVIISRSVAGVNLTRGTSVPLISVGAERVSLTVDNASTFYGRTIQYIQGYVSPSGTVIGGVNGRITRTNVVLSSSNLTSVLGGATSKDVYVLPTSASLQLVLYGEQCYAVEDLDITDGDIIYLDIFEDVKVSDNEYYTIKSMTLELVAKAALTINDANVSSIPIVDFDVMLNANPVDSDTWVIEKGKLLSSLSMTPYLSYEDGSTVSVAIDNSCCFCYGKETVDTSVAGREYTLLFKYWPSKNQPINWNMQQNQTAEGFLVCKKTLRVIEANANSLAKLSIVPVWNNTSRVYTFKYYPYYKYLTRTDAALTGVNVTQGILSGSAFGTQQSFTIATTVRDSNNQDTLFYQNAVVVLKQYNAYKTQTVALTSANINDYLGCSVKLTTSSDVVVLTTANSSTYINRSVIVVGNDPWIIADTTVSSTYGSSASPHARPVINYDTATGMYYINKSLFTTKAAFLENFFYNANPPKVNASHEDADIAITPTHFVLRSIEDDLDKTSMIAIDTNTINGVVNGYDNTAATKLLFNLNGGTGGASIGKTMLMEFYMKDATDEYVLYGVPVEVRA